MAVSGKIEYFHSTVRSIAGAKSQYLLPDAPTAPLNNRSSPLYLRKEVRLNRGGGEILSTVLRNGGRITNVVYGHFAHYGHFDRHDRL